MRSKALAFSLAICVPALLADTMSAPAQAQQLYGSHLMTQQERAKQRGFEVPNAPPAQGMRRGSGPRDGMGPGRRGPRRGR